MPPQTRARSLRASWAALPAEIVAMILCFVVGSTFANLDHPFLEAESEEEYENGLPFAQRRVRELFLLRGAVAPRAVCQQWRAVFDSLGPRVLLYNCICSDSFAAVSIAYVRGWFARQRPAFLPTEEQFMTNTWGLAWIVDVIAARAHAFPPGDRDTVKLLQEVKVWLEGNGSGFDHRYDNDIDRHPLTPFLWLVTKCPAWLFQHMQEWELANSLVGYEPNCLEDSPKRTRARFLTYYKESNPTAEQEEHVKFVGKLAMKLNDYDALAKVMTSVDVDGKTDLLLILTYKKRVDCLRRLYERGLVPWDVQYTLDIVTGGTREDKRWLCASRLLDDDARREIDIRFFQPSCQENERKRQEFAQKSTRESLLGLSKVPRAARKAAASAARKASSA